MDFEFHTQSIRTPALTLDYYLVPWDTQIFAAPVAQISELSVADPARAVQDYEVFADWCVRQRIELCACRLPADRLVDSMFLEDRGFRFVELNYVPRLTGLQALSLPQDEVSVEAALEHERDTLADIAAQVFRHGRFHQDPRVDPALGDRRYRAWMANAFTRPAQKVLKCVLDGAIVGFFVVEFPEPGHCFWSLIGLSPGLQGKGMGKRVWTAMLRTLRADGIDTVSTSISSHNVAVFNLYVSLGFRFPQPGMTLQWRAPGRGVFRQGCV